MTPKDNKFETYVQIINPMKILYLWSLQFNYKSRASGWRWHFIISRWAWDKT